MEIFLGKGPLERHVRVLLMAVLLLFSTSTLPSVAYASGCPTLSLGSRGSEVVAVQRVLFEAYEGFPTPTGYFGSTTEAALKQWQKEKGIVSSGSPSTTGYGAVGPKTRAVMGLACKTATSDAGPSMDGGAIVSKATLLESLLTQLRILQAKLATLLATSSVSSLPLVAGGASGANSTSGERVDTGATTPSCTPDQSQTQVLACPSGQVGSITQTRVSSCPGPAWGVWTTTSDTCTVSSSQPSQSDPATITNLDPHIFLKTAYVYFLDRGVGTAELVTELEFLNAQQNATPRLSVLYSFYTSSEFQSKNSLSSKSDAEWVRFMYAKILRFTGDPSVLDAAGYGSVLSRLGAGESRDSVAKTFFFSTLFAPAFLSRLTDYDVNWNGVIDMGTVVSAFADRHPQESKLVSIRRNSGAAALMTTDRITERRSGELIIQISQYSNNAWTIYSPVQITANMVGYSGTFVKPDSPENPPTYWDMNPIANRYMTISDTGRQALVNNNTYVQAGYPASTAKTLAGSGPLATRIREFGVKDFGGSIGTRWYVTQITDLSVLPSYTAEWVSFDLGPDRGIYDPEYGVLEYGHTHIPGLDPADYTYVDFGTLDNYNPHGSFFGYFSF